MGFNIESASQERILGWYPESRFTCFRMAAEAMGARHASID